MAYVQGVLERMKICVLIPAFNEEKTIAWLVRSIRGLGLDTIVIDDGSKDSTARAACDNGAQVISNERNLGKGASLRKAFDLLNARDYDALIIMDADGQHLPVDIAPFVECFSKKTPGIVVGNRMLKAKGMPFVRLCTNWAMSFVISRMCHQRVPDSQCGFRLISMDLLRKMRLNTEKFEIESEMLLEASRQGFRIESVPITTVYEGQFSAIHPIHDTIRFFNFIFKKR
jgi:glycosyltransferase involved in cell wall biosynthesis